MFLESFKKVSRTKYEYTTERGDVYLINTYCVIPKNEIDNYISEACGKRRGTLIKRGY